jgi:CheY-like chemotaxis protein
VTPHRILVVEDDPTTARLFAVTLRAAGFEVAVAADAETARVVVRWFHPRLIVLDLVLPVMSGLLLADLLGADPATEHIPLLAVSAFAENELARLARSAGCAALLAKPVDPDTLIETIRTLAGAPV